ncbi:putative MFS transporter, AGZA family, xanthine/uracil permease [Actinacidiphila yanglinensis]|uniref:Putative MFS transporter, AGZA family, xanthine/uracil permease n=1 Tax=Actinacidiphila yanglinensis TaxID=310779 RepID=A0A1H6CCX0_9ACTN|nr:NCS2 family permease [Actinacidiphila yanglinensis]SEG70831.1 putative MFS transporter, AGZA family, xanthine/uracil permease [Actinacidiphila yanglinensis]
MPGPVADAVTPAPAPPGDDNALNRWFRISERGSTPGREVRGGIATFFAMAYILVLNPIILTSSADMNHVHLHTDQVVTVTALVAAVMTVIMGVGGNLPLAIATGLGLNAVVAFQLAPQMSWPDAMGLVVLEGLLICLLVVTGLRQAIMDAIPPAIKQAIAVGIGMFIAFIGLVDAGFVTRIPDAAHNTTPVQLGSNGTLTGWPVLVFCVGVLLTVSLVARRMRGAILISIVVMTIVAIIVNKIADIPDLAWGTNPPTVPHKLVATPDFGLVGNFSLFGGFRDAGVVTCILSVFTLVLSDFFDAMGTIVGISTEAGLLDEKGRVPNIGRVLFIDGAAAVAGGLASSSSNTAFVESAAGVGEGARTGLASVVTGALFALSLFLSPLAGVVPAQAAAPALVAVGFLLMAQVRTIDWTEFDTAIPAFLTIAVMPFTYSITNGIGAGFLSYVVLKTALGKAREVHPLVWGVSVCFLAYFAIDPLQQAFGVN